MSADRSKLSRRDVMRLGAAAASAGLLSQPARAQSGRVVYATWGGSWEKAMKDAWFDPFAKETGVSVVTAQGNTYGKIRAMVEAKNTEWDVVEVNPDFQWIGAKDDLLEKLDFSVIDKSKIMAGTDLVTEYSVPQVLWSRVMFYNTKSFPNEHPKDWAEAWDLKRFPGKRTFNSKANGGALEAALIADGVPFDKIYPIDLDRAFKSLNKIRNEIIWYDTNAQGEQFMADGQAVLGLVPDGRALSAMDRKAPVAIEYNQSMMTWSTMVVPKGAPNKAAAMKFLAYAVSPKAQAAIAMAYTYGPIAPDAFKSLPPDRARMLSGGPQQEGRYLLCSEKWWGENLASVNDKLNAWRLG